MMIDEHRREQTDRPTQTVTITNFQFQIFNLVFIAIFFDTLQRDRFKTLKGASIFKGNCVV